MINAIIQAINGCQKILFIYRGLLRVAQPCGVGIQQQKMRC